MNPSTLAVLSKFLIISAWIAAVVCTLLCVFQVIDAVIVSRDPFARLSRKFEEVKLGGVYRYKKWPLVTAVIAWAWVLANYLAK